MLDSIYLMTQKLILNLGFLQYNHTYATLLWTSLHTKCSYLILMPWPYITPRHDVI